MVLTTVETLQARIAARFPTRNLVKVAEELVVLIRHSTGDSHHSRRQLMWARGISRALIALVGVLALGAFIWGLATAIGDKTLTGAQWLPLLESTVNDLIFAAVAIFFLYTIPERMLRSRALKVLHRLRSLAHIIDMHQLTKEPESLRDAFSRESDGDGTDLTQEQVEYYLEYCTELLSIVGKAAVLCAEESQDDIVLNTVSTIETLTMGMSRKVWQKVFVLSDERNLP